MELPNLLESFGEGVGRQTFLFSMLFDNEPLTKNKLEVLHYSYKILKFDLEQLAGTLKKWDGDVRLSKYYHDGKFLLFYEEVF